MGNIEERVAGANPGARTVCNALIAEQPEIAPMLLAGMETLGIIESILWYLYKDCCHNDLNEMIQVLKENRAIALLQQQRYSKFFLLSQQEDLY